MRVSNFSWSALGKFAKEGIPQLSHELRGPMGRIAVVGGSKEFCGAPYNAAQAALSRHFVLYVCFHLEQCTNSVLDLGADLVNVYCAEEAAIPIKCYNPELIVLPIYSDHDPWADENMHRELYEDIYRRARKAIDQNLDRMNALVIGPGLGIQRSFLRLRELILNFIGRNEIIKYALNGNIYTATEKQLP